ncbi:MAG: FeGP cofactor biosynthesis guanylyltransferase HcgB family protein [Euryarchaeota archaeon]
MNLGRLLLRAVRESIEGRRRGDRRGEVRAVRERLRTAERIVMATSNRKKLEAVNEVLRSFGLPEAEMHEVPTEMADATPCPALFKALLGVQTSDADVVIARGRLGVPGSGAMTVFVDDRCRILTAALSPPHVLHGMSVREAVRRETRRALERLGLRSGLRNVTEYHNTSQEE